MDEAHAEAELLEHASDNVTRKLEALLNTKRKAA